MKASSVSNAGFRASAFLVPRLRELAAQRCEKAGIRLRVPRPKLCTDNGAMLAALGAQLVLHGARPSALEIPADSALPITEVLC